MTLLVEKKQTQDNMSTLSLAFIAGSLSSSCCFVQLCLNFLSTLITLPIGCAGFNTILGPLRPYTRTLTLAWLIMSWSPLLRNKPQKNDEELSDSCCNRSINNSQDKDVQFLPRNQKRKNIMKMQFISTVMCLCLMFMPEGLKFFGGPALAPAVDNVNVIRLDYTVDKMGCEGCVYSVEGLLSSQSGVVSAKVSNFDLGEVEIYVNKAWINFEKEVFEKSLNELLVSNGYELHERGWKTMKMKFNDSFVTKLENGFLKA